MIGDQEYESRPEGAPKSVTVEPGATIYWEALAMTLNGSIAETVMKMESSTGLKVDACSARSMEEKNSCTPHGVIRESFKDDGGTKKEGMEVPKGGGGTESGIIYVY